MPCYHPVTAWFSTTVNPTGKRSLVFDEQKPHLLQDLKIPCNNCIGCWSRRSREWGTRILHESEMYEDNLFLTLTYDDENLPPYGALEKRDFQLFMKRLRQEFPQKIRYYYCGEYGDQFARPHFHACIFNLHFDDQYFWKLTKTGSKLYRSPTLEKLWTHGFSSIGQLTYQTACYVGGYVLKKQNQIKKPHPVAHDKYTGEIPQVDKWSQIKDVYGDVICEIKSKQDMLLPPEYGDMSRGYGLGKEWIKKHHKDVYSEDFVLVNERKYRPPKYYDRWYALEFPEQWEQIVKKRKERAIDNLVTDEDLLVKEEIAKARFKTLKRSYEQAHD